MFHDTQRRGRVPGRGGSAHVRGASAATGNRKRVAGRTAFPPRGAARGVGVGEGVVTRTSEVKGRSSPV